MDYFNIWPLRRKSERRLNIRTALADLFSTSLQRTAKDPRSKELAARFEHTTVSSSTLAYLVESLSGLPFLESDQDASSLLAVDPQTVNAQDQSPFFRLPAELRLKVYEYICYDLRIALALVQGARPERPRKETSPSQTTKSKRQSPSNTATTSPWTFQTTLSSSPLLPSLKISHEAWMKEAQIRPATFHLRPQHALTKPVHNNWSSLRPLGTPSFTTLQCFQALRNLGLTCKLAYVETLPALLAQNEFALADWDAKLLPLLPRLLSSDLRACVRVLDVSVGWGEFKNCGHSTLWWWKRELERSTSWDEVTAWGEAVKAVGSAFPSLRRLMIRYGPSAGLICVPGIEAVPRFLGPVDELVRGYEGRLERCIVTVRDREVYEVVRRWCEADGEGQMGEEIKLRNVKMVEEKVELSNAFWRCVEGDSGYWVQADWTEDV